MSFDARGLQAGAAPASKDPTEHMSSSLVSPSQAPAQQQEAEDNLKTQTHNQKTQALNLKTQTHNQKTQVHNLKPPTHNQKTQAHNSKPLTHDQKNRRKVGKHTNFSRPGTDFSCSSVGNGYVGNGHVGNATDT